MDTPQTRAILTVALMAAFADGRNDDRERESLRQLAEALGAESGVDCPALYRDVLLAPPSLATAVAPLDTEPLRQYAYEMAVGVVNADGSALPAEKEFLAKLAEALKLPAASAAMGAQVASSIAAAAVDPTDAAPAATPAPTATKESPPVTGQVLGKSGVDEAELERTIKRAAVTNAALELLPESIASMAIIPLQIRLVYRIGRAYGYEMDLSHAKEFIATLGVGLTSQYVEQLGRKVLGGLLGTIAGGLGRMVGHQFASSGLTFATTYAIGRVAQRYYAGGRTLDAATLKTTFASLVEEARELLPQYRSQIEQTARTIDTRQLVSLVKQV
jgi:uncharacterized protein (DUF697 family)